MEGRRLIGPLACGALAEKSNVARPSFSVTVTAHYPAYLGLEDEPVPLAGDTVLLPAGTRLETQGQATAALVSAGWEIGGQVEPLTVASTRFSGSFVPPRSGTYRLALASAEGSALAGDTLRLPVRVVPDSAPRVGTLSRPCA